MSDVTTKIVIAELLVAYGVKEEGQSFIVCAGCRRKSNISNGCTDFDLPPCLICGTGRYVIAKNDYLRWYIERVPVSNVAFDTYYRRTYTMDLQKTKLRGAFANAMEEELNRNPKEIKQKIDNPAYMGSKYEPYFFTKKSLAVTHVDEMKGDHDDDSQVHG